MDIFNGALSAQPYGSSAAEYVFRWDLAEKGGNILRSNCPTQMTSDWFIFRFEKSQVKESCYEFLFIKI